MFLSVIIAVYNAENYIRECLESIEMQSQSDYEIILVDDGSEDSSRAVCEEFAKKNENTFLISASHRGAAAARNEGLRRAKGEYVLFLDSDDFIIRKDFFALLKSESEKADEAIFFKYCDYYDGAKTLTPCSFSYKSAINAENYGEKIQALVEADAFYGMAWTKCIKREFLVENGISFEEGLKGEDMDWNFRLISELEDIDFIDEPFIAYRRRSGSASGENSLKSLSDFIHIIKKWKNETEKLENETLKNALSGALAKYYSNLLIVYTRVEDDKKKIYLPEIKALASLLKYASSKRPKLVAKAYSAGGMKLTLLLLRLKDKRNRH